MKKSTGKLQVKKGFTIVELVVVIVVIGILSSLVIVGFTKYMADTRDNRRAADMTVIAEALEKYYDQHGEYPGCAALTASISTVTSTTLKDVDQSALIAPSSPDPTQNSLKCSTLTLNGDDFYEYIGDGSGSCSTGTSCLSFTLRYKDEGDNQIATIPSRHTTALTTSGTSTLTLGTVTYTRISFSWTSVQNAASYVLQRAATCGNFTSPAPAEIPVSGTSTTLTGYTPGSSYCFRVLGKSGSGQVTDPSNTVAVTTQSLATPVPTVGSPTNTSLVLSWPAVSGASSYDFEETTGGFTGTPTVTGFTGLTTTRTGLTTGTTYNYKVRAATVDSGTPVQSAWSNTASGIPMVPSPTNIALNWTNNYGSSSQSASCSLGSPQFARAITYRTDGSTADNWQAYSAYTTSTTFADDFIAEGQYGKVKIMVKCVYGGADSDEVESSTITKVRPITSISAGTWYNRQTSPALIGVGGSCVSGTVSMYKWGQIWHGSAGYHSGGGWGQWGDFQLTNGTPNYSMNDGLNVYRISRTICQTNYWERSMTSQVPGGTLGACCGGITTYNSFVNAGYNYSVAR